ncbi:MAG TPA: right-handed parallel beta-helix repeat-containing protein [Thermoanaerobaculia bacterium]|nr:right-handed parallel beta-helix repeat-containing protein [Thermoanaerobaculia bacterium]
MRHLIIAGLLVLTASTALAADTYYVSVLGSDTNPGTEALPFRTITKAVNLVNEANDRVYVKAGVYNERVLVYEKHGDENLPIRIQGWGADVPVIDGTGVSGNGLVEINKSSYVNFDQFEVKNAPNAGIFIYNANNIKVRYNKVHGSHAAGINASTSHSSPRGTTHSILIQGNRVYDNVRQNVTGNAAEWQQGLSAYRAHNVQIIGNSVYENYGEGVDYIMSTSGLIADNRIRDNFSINLYLDNATDTVVERNFIHSYGYTQFYRGGDPAGGIGMANEDYYEGSVQVQNPLNNNRIVNNIILRASNGIAYGNWDYDHGMHNTLIANNTVYSSKYYNLYIQNGRDGSNVHSTTKIENNIFVQDASTKSYASAPTVGITYAYNAWYGGNSSSRIIGGGDVNANPLFADHGGWDDFDYKLTTGSPCINTGTTQTSFATDFFGGTTAVRTSGSYDIGADEF